MRRLLLPVLVCVLSWSQTALSQTLVARRHNLGLEAQSVANGGASQVLNNGSGLPWTTDAVTVQSVLLDRRVANNRTNLKISVKNFGTGVDNVRVEWFFVGLPVQQAAAGSHEIIFHHDGQDLAIPGGKTAEQVVSSPEVQAVYDRATTVTTAPNGYPYNGSYSSVLSSANTQKGLTIRGWMVRLVAEDGSVILARGSSQTYEEMAANPAKLAGMLARPGGVSQDGR